MSRWTENGQAEWEDVASPTPGDYLERIPVPGGWLYRTMIDLNLRSGDDVKACNQPAPMLAMVFVPRPAWMP